MIVRGGTVVLPGAVPVAADVAVEDGLIAAIGPELEGDGEELDARGLHVLPGAIDAHVHFNEPGRADWEGWETGTAALAAGGATACVEMPLNAHPPTVDGAAFDAKVAAARAVGEGRLRALGRARARPARAAWTSSPSAAWPASRRSCAIRGSTTSTPSTTTSSARAWSARPRSACPCSCTRSAPPSCGPMDGDDWRAWVASRPPRAELAAIERAIALAEQAGCSLHVVHVSTGAGVAAVAEARARGGDVTCETCPHYLALTEDDLERLGTLAKCAPPLRAGRRARRALGAPRPRPDHARRLRPLAVPAGDEGGRLREGLGRHRGRAVDARRAAARGGGARPAARRRSPSS